MTIRRFLSLLLIPLLLGTAALANAAEVDCDDIYCFSPEDFSEENQLGGICITGLPENGTLMLGS